MTLPTRANLPLRSPLPSVAEQEILSPGNELVLTDLTGLGIEHVRNTPKGTRSEGGDLSGDIGELRPIDGALIARLTAEEWVVITPGGEEVPLHAEAARLHTVTDVSHGNGVLLIAGQQAAAVLSKLSPVNLSDADFPNLHCVQTSLAKVRTLLLRRDLHEKPAFVLAVGRSVSEYVWRILLNAADEFRPQIGRGSDWVPALIAGTRSGGKHG